MTQNFPIFTLIQTLPRWKTYFPAPNCLFSLSALWRRAGFTVSRIRNRESCGYVAPWLMVKGCIAIFWSFYILNCPASVSRPLVNPCRRRSRFRQSASSRFCPALTRLRFMAIEFGRSRCPRFQASYLPACPPHLAAE